MAEEKYNIEIAIKTQAESLKKVQSALDEINEKVKDFSEQASNTGKIWTGAMMNIGTQISNLAMKLPHAATAAIQAFGEEEVALNKLSAAIRSQGGNVSEVLPIMQQFASEMQKITTYGDEQILAMQGVATSMGVSSDQMDSVMKSAIGLSAALGMDVATATKAASAAIQGKTELLTRYIPMLSECKTSEEKFAKVQELSRNGFAQAKAEGESTLGQLKQAANAWGDLAEVAGKTFAPVAVEVAGALKFVCETLTANSGIVQVFIGGLASLAAGFAFTKIGGLANVVGLFKMVAGAISGTKAASDALNFSLKMNPLGVAITAVTAFGMVVSHLSGQGKERYNQNIEKSKEYRDALDAEIDTLKQWGISAEGNKKRTKEISDEIAKLKKERADLERSSMRTVNAGTSGGVSVYIDPAAKAELDNLRAKIEQLEKVLQAYAPVKKLAANAEKQHADAVKKSNEILEKSDAEQRAAKSASEELKQTRQAYAATEKEIAVLEEQRKKNVWTDAERTAKALRLAEARRELVKLGKQENEQMLKLQSSKLDAGKTEAVKEQYDIEVKLAGARLRGNAVEIQNYQTELDAAKLQVKRFDILSNYIGARKAEIKTAEDLKRIKSAAYQYANATLAIEEKAAAEAAEKAATEKWLAADLEKSKAVQRGLEYDILKARASGNESQAKDLEGKLRIAQLSAEIFENTRKEGMSRKELETLQQSANKQAQERYNLEKSVTDEVERQNLAKDAQAKIEDILITNKIEQLKAEGKLTAAKELEREREIKRTMAGMKGLSGEDKKTVEKALRQTNEYRDKQEKDREEKSAKSGSARASKGSSASFGGGSSSNDGIMRIGGTSRETGRPATVSKKSAALYDEWKAAGGSKSGTSWSDFRKEKSQPDSQKKLQGEARGLLGGIEAQSKAIGGRVTLKGAVDSASNTAEKSAAASTRIQPAKLGQPQSKIAAAPAINNKLDAMGAGSEAKGSEDTQAQSLGQIATAVTAMGEDIKTLKTTVTALVEKKKG